MLPNLEDLSEAQITAMLDGWCEDLPDGRRLLRLEYPTTIKIAAAGRKAEPTEIAELTFRRPKASILDLATGRDQVKAARAMLAAMIEPPLDGVRLEERHVAELDMDDFVRASLVMGRFFLKPPAPEALETGGI